MPAQLLPWDGGTGYHGGILPGKELGWHCSPFTNGNGQGEARGSTAADLSFNGGHPVGLEAVKEWEMGLAAGPDGGIIPTP